MSNPVIQLLEKRYPGRSIAKDKPLSDEILNELKEAIRLTPSCFNNQPWRFLWITSDEAREKATQIFRPGNDAWAPRAPLIIVGYTRVDDDCKIPDGRQYHQFDLGMSVMNLMLAATHHGLAARPMAGFKPKIVRELFGLEEEALPLVAISIGYTEKDESYLPEKYIGAADKPRTRKDASEFLKEL